VLKRLATAAAAAIALLGVQHAPAGRLDPALETRLSAAGPSEKIRIIVEMKEQARPRDLIRALPKGARKAKLKALLAGLKDKARRRQAGIEAELAREQTMGAAERVVPFWVFNGLALRANPGLIRRLAARDDVLEVRLDQEIPPPPRPAEASAPSGPTEWNIAHIRAPEVWALDPAYNGQGTVVGSFDTGVDLAHPELFERYRGNHAISWFDPYGEHSLPTDFNGHGTHTIATAVGGSAGGSAIGVAPGAKWIAAKAWADNGVGLASAFHSIFEWFLAPGGDPDNAPDVVNNSWAFVAAGCNSEFVPDIEAWRAAEIFPAFAAGNAGPSAGSVRSPGAYAESFAVGATDVFDEVASFSSRGPSPCTALDKPDLAAPGAAIHSALPGNSYGVLSGTSMATPHVAGAVAVLRSIKPDMTVEDLAIALTLGATDIAQPGPDHDSGAGRLDLLTSAEIAINGPSAPVVKVVTTTPTVSETGPDGVLTFTRTGDTASPLHVNISVAGTASPGSDYIALPLGLTIPGGSASATLAITPIDDTLGEINETVLVSIEPDPAYIRGWSRVASVIVVSDELLPDLTVTAMSAPAGASAGDTITVSEITNNVGAGPAPATLTRYFLSADLTLDASDVALGSRAVPALGPGTSSAGSAAVTVPSGIANGLWYLIAKADGDDALSESSEFNNTAWRSIQIGVDLVVYGMSGPSNVSPGQSITVSDTTRNQGAGTAPASVTQFFLSSNGTLDAADIALGSRVVSPLVAGASSSGATALTIPAGTATGYWYVLAKADGADDVPEASESNNIGSWAFAIGADLVVFSLTVPPTAAAGQSIIVTDTNRNQGNGSAAASMTRYFLSIDTMLDASDAPLGERSVTPLSAGASDTASTALTIPVGTATGAWYVLAKADAGESVPETSEVNNVASRSLQVGADLVVSAWSAPSSAGAGESITVTDTTRNQGGGAAPASVTQYFLSANSTLDGADVALGSRTVPALGSGASSSGSITVMLPAEIANGTWYLIAKADATQSVVEVSELNNTAQRGVLVGVDLIVSALSGPVAASAGQSISVSDTTRNQGGGVAPASVTQLFLSSNSTLDASDIGLGSRAVPALASGASSSGSTTLVIPAGTAAGSWYMIATADGSGVVPETSEGNNVGTWSIQIGADLVVSALTVPASAGPGQAITVTDTTRNQAGGAAAATVTQYFLSGDAVLDAGDVALGSRNVTALAGGASNSASTSVAIPAGTATGNWFVIAKADASDVVLEIVETNNTVSRSIQIGPDLSVISLSAPSAAGAGGTITVTDTTRNLSTGSAPETSTHYFLSANSTLDATDVLLGARTVPALAPGASNSGSAALTLPSGTATGVWYLIAKADGNDSLPESSESNNVTWRSIQVGVDMLVYTLSGPTGVNAGQSISVNDTTRNQGGGAAPASTTQFFLSSNSALDAADISLGSRAVPALAAGTSSSGATTLTIPAGTATGYWYLLGKADAAGEVLEVSETNNVTARAMSVGPDLVAYSLAGPSTAAAGQTITVSDITRNQGGGDAAASTTEFFLSRDTMLDAADIPLGGRTVGALAGGATSMASTALTIPLDTPTGGWYVIGRVDGGNAVVEVSEVNNGNARWIQITAPQ
jgi:subtilase family serine protease/subtilisin family serine protease